MIMNCICITNRVYCCVTCISNFMLCAQRNVLIFAIGQCYARQFWMGLFKMRHSEKIEGTVPLKKFH